MDESRARVLIVDDDPDVRLLLSDALARHGFDPVCANDGGEAIELIESGFRPAVVLADLVMPGIIGNELLEYLRGDECLRHIPVAIVTGSPAMAPGGYTVFTKPAPLCDLLAFVSHAAKPTPRDHELRAH
jgi:two-component system sensor histidine kinase/response regulator